MVISSTSFVSDNFFKNNYLLLPHIFWHAPIHHTITSSSYQYPSSNHISNCSCVTNQSETNCREEGSSSTALLHIFCFKVIKDIPQAPWAYFKCLDTHVLSFKRIRNKKKYCWVVGYSLVAHFLGYEAIRNIQQGIWFPEHCFVTHPLRYEMIWDMR